MSQVFPALWGCICLGLLSLACEGIHHSDVSSLEASTASHSSASTNTDKVKQVQGTAAEAVEGVSTEALVDAMGHVSFSRSLSVTGNLQANSIHAGSASVAGTLHAASVDAKQTVTAPTASFHTIEASQIRGRNGDKVRISGDVTVGTTGNRAEVFLSLDEYESQEQHGRASWTLAYSESFDSLPRSSSPKEEPATLDEVPAASKPQWTPFETSSCSKGVMGSNTAPLVPDVFLGGHCNFASTTSSLTLEGLPPHSAVRFQARVHFIDAWRGESLVLRVDGRPAWVDACGAARPDGEVPPPGHGLDVCGGAWPEERLSQNIDVVVPHGGAGEESESVTLSMGSTLADLPCQHSWGLDDVRVYLRLL